ncbi:VWA domain-containing protein [Hoyosella subflava]|uniref:Magnesium-chelatase subunit D n=1 Tax=Hoyosella subflava (strain DSM 45089 / JCM 17490 / NBRC 109087 / DQS3-9A1) TaxID=443218 RepID=F6EEF3_HOYSD|nr:VWA domain-containing protein [Hoyosella subflava]AEF38605.1 Magnesium-chelatase subunit D [Hoyosella subflava DQS3-9A1]
MCIEPDPRELLSASDWALCETWLRGGEFGLLLVGDNWGREQLWRELALAAKGSGTMQLVPAADLVDTEGVAQFPMRILAAAPDTESVPPILLRRVTCIIGVQASPVRKPKRIPPSPDLTRAVVEALEANGLRDHGLDVTAGRFTHAVAQMRGSAKAGLEALYRTVIAPRLLGPAGADPDGSVGRSDADEDADQSAGQPPEADSAPDHGDTATEGSSADASETANVTESHADEESAAEPSELLEAPPTCQPPEQARLRGPTVRASTRRGPQVHSDRGRPGRVVSVERAQGKVAIHPTLVAAARRHAAGQGEQYRVTRADLRGMLRTGRAKTVTIVIVDRSDSMGMLRIRQATAIATDALERAYRDRCDVAVISARGAKAQLVLPPTRGLLRAHRVITKLPSGGGTPLASAFQLARVVAAPYLARRNVAVRVLVVTDGSATVKLDPDEAAGAVEQAAEQLTMLAAALPVEVLPLTHTGRRVSAEDLAWLERAGAAFTVVRTVGGT